MKRASAPVFLAFSSVLFILSACNQPPQNSGENSSSTEINQAENNTESASAQTVQYKEGTDYQVYERVRFLDKQGFAEPQEAYSLLLPKGWKHHAEISWVGPGENCAGTYKTLNANSADNKYSLQMYPDLVFSWNTNPELMQFNQSQQSGKYCRFSEPVDAETYLRKYFATEELGDAQIVKVEPNKLVVQQMQQGNQKAINELQRYGATQLQFHQTAINATVKWPDGTEGLVILGANTLENTVPNMYNGTFDKIYTTQITNRMVYKYPKGEGEEAKNQLSVIMGSFRSNPAWNDAVNGFWRNIREQKHVAHIGKLKMMDEQTRQMGEQAIKSGQQRLKQMDNQMRSWESSQNSQDRMHTNFIKTIREVENYKDETGTYEISSSYTNAWSRGDGSSFVMSNNPNFNPAAVFQDQSWKEMKKVD